MARIIVAKIKFASHLRKMSVRASASYGTRGRWSVKRILAALVMIAAVMTQASPDDDIKLNQIQLIGTHNSYHAGLPPPIAALLAAEDPELARSLDYSHPSITQQLSSGIRQLEFDIYADSKGGRYARPLGPRWALERGLPMASPAYADGVMEAPGFKVLHMQDVDYVSTCQPFRACLEEVRSWSDSHPGHLPLFLLIETKRSEGRWRWESGTTDPFTGETLDGLDSEIRSVFSEDRLITPDKVRGDYPTLERAVLDHGWPSLAEARGKMVFLLDQKNVSAAYLSSHPALRGRVLFTNADPGSPDAAFVERNKASAGEIADLVRKGYLVRTRTDWDTVQARSNDISRRDGAMASGAQILSTDYPPEEPSRWTGYEVAFPEGTVRCNPVLTVEACRFKPPAP
jgi:hypothetical protein